MLKKIFIFCFFLSCSGFLECVGEKVPSEEELLVTLRNAVANSARKRYHGDKGIEVLSPEGKKKKKSLANSLSLSWVDFSFFQSLRSSGWELSSHWGS